MSFSIRQLKRKCLRVFLFWQVSFFFFFFFKHVVLWATKAFGFFFSTSLPFTPLQICQCLLAIELITSPWAEENLLPLPLIYCLLLILVKLLPIITFETSKPMWAVSKIASQGAVPAHCDHITTIVLAMRLQYDLQANVFEAAHLKENTSSLVHLITAESGKSCSYRTWFVEGLNVSYHAGGKLEFSLTLWQSMPLAPHSSQRCAHPTQPHERAP